MTKFGKQRINLRLFNDGAAKINAMPGLLRTQTFLEYKTITLNKIITEKQGKKT